LLDFLAGAFFFAAIKLTTFHAVRDLPVAPTWQQKPDFSGQLSFAWRLEREGRDDDLSTFTRPARLLFQFVAVIVLS
jgi:hypothetical protein